MKDLDYIKALTDIDERFVEEAKDFHYRFTKESKHKVHKVVSLKRIAMIALAAIMCTTFVLVGTTTKDYVNIGIVQFNEDDYVYYGPNEDGICYIPLSTIRRENGSISAETQNVSFKGTAIFTDANGNPFEVAYQEFDTVSILLKSPDENTNITFGLVSDGVYSDGVRYGENVMGIGTSIEYDTDTKVYGYAKSEDVAYLDFVKINSSYLTGIRGGETFYNYYLNGKLYKSNESNIDMNTGVIDIPLESVNDNSLSIGNMVSVAFSKELSENLNIGDKITINIDLEGEECRWTIEGRIVGDDRPIYVVNSRDCDVEITFEISTEGSYEFRLINEATNYLDIKSAEIKIN